MSPVSAIANSEPYLASSVMGFVLFMIAAAYFVLWWRDREPGAAWFATSLALGGAWYWTTPTNLSAGRMQAWSAWYVVLDAALACMSLGLIRYIGLTAPRRRIALWSTLSPAALHLAMMVLGIGMADASVPRSMFNLPVGAWFFAMGAIAWMAARHEPGAGHVWVAMVFWCIPPVVAALALGGHDAVPLRFPAFAPVLLLALTLLTVVLMRRSCRLEIEVRRRGLAEDALKSTNASLELAVAQRTADLQNIVSGLETFNRNVSHDLRGSLGGMAGVARLADESLRRGDCTLARQALPLIASQADQLTRLVEALLQLARVGDAAVAREAVDLVRVVEEVIEQITLERGPEGMPSIVVQPMPLAYADRELLKPVFKNLIGNAVKFSRGNSTDRIEIGASTTTEALTVHVRDNGVGFDTGAAARLFTPFVRLHGTKYAGNGIGLSIVRRAVERHGGQVWAESQPTKGTSFRFTLPLVGP